jgi:hypothetical protein
MRRFSFEIRGGAAGLLAVGLLLLVLLAGCDCAEGDVTSAFGPRCDDDVLMEAMEGAQTVLVSDRSNSSIRRFSRISNLNSAVETDLPVSGSLTRLSRPGYLSIHPTTRELIVPDAGIGAVLFFSSISDLEGNTPPQRALIGGATELSGPVQVYVDSSTDELYVLDQANSQILVYQAASSVDGEVAPVRRVGGVASSMNSPNAFFVDSSRERISVLNGNEVLTFNNFRSLNGAPPPAGRFFGAATTFNELTFGTLTSQGSLILVDAGSDQIVAFDSWIFDQSNVAPTRIAAGSNVGISNPGQFELVGNTMYLVDGGSVLVFEDVLNLEGNDFPARRFSGLNPLTQGLQGLVLP